jgi:hypothetical protein
MTDNNDNGPDDASRALGMLYYHYLFFLLTKNPQWNDNNVDYCQQRMATTWDGDENGPDDAIRYVFFLFVLVLYALIGFLLTSTDLTTTWDNCQQRMTMTWDSDENG